MRGSIGRERQRGRDDADRRSLDGLPGPVDSTPDNWLVRVDSIGFTPTSGQPNRFTGTRLRMTGGSETVAPTYEGLPGEVVFTSLRRIPESGEKMIVYRVGSRWVTDVPAASAPSTCTAGVLTVCCASCVHAVPRTLYLTDEHGGSTLTYGNGVFGFGWYGSRNVSTDEKISCHPITGVANCTSIITGDVQLVYVLFCPNPPSFTDFQLKVCCLGPWCSTTPRYGVCADGTTQYRYHQPEFPPSKTSGGCGSPFAIEFDVGTGGWGGNALVVPQDPYFTATPLVTGTITIAA